MVKCPLNGKCKIDASLLESIGVEDTRSERYKYDHVICNGNGTSPNSWMNCIKYDPAVVSGLTETAKRQNRNMKIGVIIGVIMILLFLIFHFENLHKEYSFIETVGIILITTIIWGPLYGIGFSSILLTVDAITQYLVFCMNLSRAMGYILFVILFIFVMPWLVAFFITSIVGIVRYFMRRKRLKYDLAR